MSSRQLSAAGLINSSVLVATVAAVMPFAAYGQTKPNVTVINPVSNPVNTRITNTVVPVEISNADPVSVQTAPVATPLDRYLATQVNVSPSASNDDDIFTATTPVQLTGVMLQVNARGTSGSCTYTIAIANSNGGFLTPVASVLVVAGRSLSSPVVPLPNLAIPAGYQIKYYVANDTGEQCEGNIVLYMTRP